jgi:PKD repeat protein
LYGVGGIPDAYFNGYLNVLGGQPSGSMNYQPQYNQIINTDSPLAIEVSMTITSRDEILIQADVELTDDITTTNNKIVYILTYQFDDDWFCVALSYDYETFGLTDVGETGTYEHSVTMDPSWDLVNLKASVLVQTFSGNKEIFQGASTSFSGLLPMFTANITEGPAYLGVQFTSVSFPQEGIESWEWDFDGDGIFDFNYENPYWLYDEPGSYDVTLRICVEGEYAETTVEDFITVTDGLNITGNLSGLWIPDFNPYVITDEVTIAEGDQLLISPGVEIIILDNNQIVVNGNLTANALGSETITFSSNTEWEGILFSDTHSNNLLSNCEFTDVSNSCIEIEYDSSVDIIGNWFINNSSSSNKGTAINIIGSDNVLIHKNIIANNTNTNLTGGISCDASSPIISNNLIVNNSGTTAGALSFKSGSVPTLINNTIANNQASNCIFVFNSSPVIMNSIIIHDGNIFNAIGSDPEVSYTCISGGYTGEGNIDVDPLFEQPSTGNGPEYNGYNALWYLTEGSECIDAGNPAEEYYDIEDPADPGFALWPAMGTLTNDMGVFGGEGFFEYVSSEDNLVNIISHSDLKVYPNPFNPTTNISLQINSEDAVHPVTLGIYNIKGQLVKTIVNNEIVNNNPCFVWNGIDNSGLRTSSGIYLVKLETASSVSTQKIIMLK